MKPGILKEERELLGAKYMPAVSIILPLESKISLRTELDHRLKLAMGKVEKELMANYPSEKAIPVLNKLRQLLTHLDYDTNKKSIALFASPLMERVFYLDVAVEERIVIDESFEIRDLVYSKKQTIQYLVLLLSGKTSRMYLGNCSSFIKIKSTLPDNLNAYLRDMPERVGQYSDNREHKEIMLDQFLHHMDLGLAEVLKSYPLAVFVLGAKRDLGHFKTITHHKNQIVEYIHGNYEESTDAEIRDVLKPYVDAWKKKSQQASLQAVEDAMNENKLAFGMKAVWEAASQKNGRILVVEKDFVFPAREGASPDKISKEDSPATHNLHIKDAVDDVMEKILSGGGDVEFVDNGSLINYGHIALVKYF